MLGSPLTGFHPKEAAMSEHSLPLVYSCSGCSNVAQLANSLALRLDRAALAEMSCIAGVGGHVPPLVAKATSGRRIVALDGCVLHCTKACLAQHGVTSDVHLTLSEFGVKKRYGEDCPSSLTDTLFAEIRDLISTVPVE